MLNLTLIIVFVLLLIGFFKPIRESIDMSPMEGTIFSFQMDENMSNINLPITDVVLYEKNENKKEDNSLPVISIKEDINFPLKFIGVQDNNGEYFLSKNSDVEILVPTKKIRSLNTKMKSNSEPGVNVVEKETNNQIIYDYFVLNNEIKGSQNSYYFSNVKEMIRNVSLSVVSLTPYKDKDILRFEITNGQNDYFFIERISLIRNNQVVPVQFFNENLVGPSKTISGLVLMPRFKREKLSLIAIESGGKNRKFEINFSST